MQNILASPIISEDVFVVKGIICSSLVDDELSRVPLILLYTPTTM